jgi:hypothetical protein
MTEMPNLARHPGSPLSDSWLRFIGLPSVHDELSTRLLRLQGSHESKKFCRVKSPEEVYFLPLFAKSLYGLWNLQTRFIQCDR